MIDTLKTLFWRLPKLRGIRALQVELEQHRQALDQRQRELDRQGQALADKAWMLRKYQALAEGSINAAHVNSVEHTPWRHPYLSEGNIRRFRAYSEAVWRFARVYADRRPEALRAAFVINMAQNMYKWARMAQQQGADATLVLHPHEQTALNMPEWEEFDGAYPDLLDGAGFLAAHPELAARVAVPVERPQMDGEALLMAYRRFLGGERRPLLTLLAQTPGLRYEALTTYDAIYSYYAWAAQLARFDVLYTNGPSPAAYASGRPYCMFSFGGDLMFDAGRGDDYGRVMNLAANAARFIPISNPHTLGHARRLGLHNGVYLPYPMDEGRYCPGEGRARREWAAQYGGAVFALMTTRLDAGVKGQDAGFFQALVDVARQRPTLRFIFLAWGKGAEEFRRRVAAAGVGGQFILLPPVGKQRLIDYYRSCDMVIDQLVWGYYGATALEAAAVGQPVVMKLRSDQYRALYAEDMMPAHNVDGADALGRALLRLSDDAALRHESGAAMRAWLLRNHGEAHTMPLLLALLRLTADRIPLPEEIARENPLLDPLTEVEEAYHQSCLEPTS